MSSVLAATLVRRMQRRHLNLAFRQRHCAGKHISNGKCQDAFELLWLQNSESLELAQE